MNDAVSRSEFNRLQGVVDSVTTSTQEIKGSIVRLEVGQKHIFDHIKAQDKRNGEQNREIDGLIKQIIRWKAALAVIIGGPSLVYILIRVGQAISIS